MSQEISVDIASSVTAVSKDARWTSDGSRKSVSSVSKAIETVSTPSSSSEDDVESTSSHVTVVHSGSSSPSVTNNLSKTSADSEMLRVSEPISSSSQDSTALIHDTGSDVHVVFRGAWNDAGSSQYAVSDVDVTSHSHGESVIFPSAVAASSDTEHRKTPSDKSVDTAAGIHVVVVPEICITDYEREPTYPRHDENVLDECRDNAAKVTSDVQVAEDYMVHDETAEHKMHALVVEASKNSIKFSPEVSTTDVEVTENITEDIADDTVEETTAVHVSAMLLSDSTRLENISLEDLLASEASIDQIDVLPLDELPSAADEAVQINAEMMMFQKEDVDSSMAEHYQMTYSEWPPLPSDEQLKISETELELSKDDYVVYTEDKDIDVLETATLQHDFPVGLPSSEQLKISKTKLDLPEDDISVGLPSSEQLKISKTELDLPEDDISVGLPSSEQLKISKTELELPEDDISVGLPSSEQLKISKTELELPEDDISVGLPSSEQLKISKTELELPEDDDKDSDLLQPLPQHDLSVGLPSDQELKISETKSDPSKDYHVESSDNKDTDLETAVPQQDVSVGKESGTVTKVGASENPLLTHCSTFERHRQHASIQVNLSTSLLTL